MLRNHRSGFGLFILAAILITLFPALRFGGYYSGGWTQWCFLFLPATFNNLTFNQLNVPIMLAEYVLAALSGVALEFIISFFRERKKSSIERARLSKRAKWAIFISLLFLLLLAVFVYPTMWKEVESGGNYRLRELRFNNSFEQILSESGWVPIWGDTINDPSINKMVTGEGRLEWGYHGYSFDATIHNLSRWTVTRIDIGLSVYTKVDSDSVLVARRVVLWCNNKLNRAIPYSVSTFSGNVDEDLNPYLFNYDCRFEWYFLRYYGYKDSLLGNKGENGEWHKKI